MSKNEVEMMSPIRWPGYMRVLEHHPDIEEVLWVFGGRRDARMTTSRHGASRIPSVELEDTVVHMLGDVELHEQYAHTRCRMERLKRWRDMMKGGREEEGRRRRGRWGDGKTQDLKRVEPILRARVRPFCDWPENASL